MSWTSKGLARALAGGNSGDFRLVLMKDPYVQSPQHVYLSDVTQWEPSGPGYSRKVLGPLSIGEDLSVSANFVSLYASGDPAPYPGANFGTVVGAWVVNWSGSASTSVLWNFLKISPVAVTDGGELQLLWPSDGAGKIVIKKDFA